MSHAWKQLDPLSSYQVQCTKCGLQADIGEWPNPRCVDARGFTLLEEVEQGTEVPNPGVPG